MYLHLKNMRAIISGERGIMFIQVTTDAGNQIIVNTEQVCWLDENKVTMSNGLTIGVTDESIKKVENVIYRGRNKAEVNDDNKDLVELFSKLHKLTGGKGKPIFNVKRQNQLKFLLDPKKGNMTEEQLITAATNIGKDAFLQGENENNKRYGDIDYLLRQDKASKWAEATPEKKKGMF
jgi:hypothetical protein